MDVALGTVDYLELVSNSGHLATSQVWHRILNCGFRVSITGGEDSISNLYRIAVVGADRTYAHLGPALDWKRWIEAIRQGRTFATNGPLTSNFFREMDVRRHYSSSRSRRLWNVARGLWDFARQVLWQGLAGANRTHHLRRLPREEAPRIIRWSFTKGLESKTIRRG